MSSDVNQMRTWVGRQLDAAKTMNLAEAAARLAEIDELRNDLGALAGDLGKRIIALKPSDVKEGVLVESGGTAAVVKVTRAKPKQIWDDEKLLRHVVAKGLDSRVMDPNTAEFEREGDAMVRVLGQVWRLDGTSARTTPLKALGLNPNDFREFERSTADPKIDVRLAGR